MAPKRGYVERGSKSVVDQSSESRNARMDGCSDPRRTHHKTHQRQFITPVGNDSFRPHNIIRRIIPECVMPFFKTGWTTITTCDPKAKSVWFNKFQQLFTWDPAHDTWVRNNFNTKVGKLLRSRWSYIRKKMQETNKSNTRGDEDLNSRHGTGGIPMNPTREKLRIELERESTTMEDRSFLDPDDQEIVGSLENNEHTRHESDSDETQYCQSEDIETYAREVGLKSREKSPHLNETIATVVEGPNSPNITSSAQSSLNIMQRLDALADKVAAQDHNIQRMTELLMRALASRPTDLPPPQQ